MVAKFLDLLNENVTFIMTFLCMVALRVKLVDHTFEGLNGVVAFTVVGYNYGSFKAIG